MAQTGSGALIVLCSLLGITGFWHHYVSANRVLVPLLAGAGLPRSRSTRAQETASTWRPTSIPTGGSPRVRRVSASTWSPPQEHCCSSAGSYAPACRKRCESSAAVLASSKCTAYAPISGISPATAPLIPASARLRQVIANPRCACASARLTGSSRGATMRWVSTGGVECFRWVVSSSGVSRDRHWARRFGAGCGWPCAGSWLSHGSSSSRKRREADLRARAG